MGIFRPPSNNILECTREVTGSYDPNDKRVVPEGIAAPGYIFRHDSLLNYTIRFQNTGTDTAFTVLIRDTLPPELDITTLVPLPSCRPYKMDVEEDNILVFTFENILLPDSTTNEPESHGFVMYDIQLKPGLEPGREIKNKAAIYFDYNAPIITNTALNTLFECSLDIEADEIIPASGSTSSHSDGQVLITPHSQT